MNAKRIIFIIFLMIGIIVAMFFTVKKNQKNIESNDYGNGNNNNYDTSIPVINLNIGLDMLELNVGQTQKLNYKMDPINATNPNLEWKSSNENVAKVDNNGNVTAISSGEAIITLTSLSSNKSDACRINVIDYKVNNISLATTNLTLKKGDKYQINPFLSPTKANRDNLTYTSSNNNVATVTKTGEVTAINYGTATINIESNNIIRTININISDSNVKPTCPDNSYYLSSDNTLCIHAIKYSACPTGYRYDSSRKICMQVANPVCPKNTTYIGNGICKQIKTVEPVCSKGNYDSKTKKCLIKNKPYCSSGIFSPSKNKCVNNTTTTSIKCSSGTYNSTTKTCNKYVNFTCPSGYKINTKNGTCEIAIKKSACPKGTGYDSKLEKCLIKATPSCDKKHNFETNGYCTGIDTIASTCPKGYSFDKGKCLIN